VNLSLLLKQPCPDEVAARARDFVRYGVTAESHIEVARYLDDKTRGDEAALFLRHLQGDPRNQAVALYIPRSAMPDGLDLRVSLRS
jgi:hypothetical protein